MNLKNLAMISFVENKIKRNTMVAYVYDDNINQKIDIQKKIIPIRRGKSLMKSIQKVYPDVFIETKMKKDSVLINKPIYERMICNLQHTYTAGV